NEQGGKADRKEQPQPEHGELVEGSGKSMGELEAPDSRERIGVPFGVIVSVLQDKEPGGHGCSRERERQECHDKHHLSPFPLRQEARQDEAEREGGRATQSEERGHGSYLLWRFPAFQDKHRERAGAYRYTPERRAAERRQYWGQHAGERTRQPGRTLGC